MLGADGAFLMPGHGSCASGLMAYRARVAENKTAGLMGVEEALAKVPVEALPDERVQSAQPTVGILFSEWFQLGARSMVEVIQLVRDHGCRPLLILPMADALVAEDQAQRLSAIEQLTQQLDGLIALGGKDIDPSIYGQRNQASLHVNLTRDRFDSSILLNALLGRQMYLLAICRSHQLVNATLGGELIQDMRSAGYAEISRNQTDYAVPSDQPFQLKDAQGGVIFSHDVDVLPESDAGQIIGQTPLLTNSFHHQVVSSPGKNLRVCGTLHDAKLNKRTIEMTESWQLTSLQFHPERLLALEVFEKLAGTACRRAHLFFQQKLAPVADAAAAGQWMENFQGQKPFLPADKTWISRNFARIRI
jgi:putative glutamine amidotransferase